MKKTISVLLAVAMVLGLSVTAAAQTYETQVTAEGTGIEAFVLVVPEDLTAGGDAGEVSLTGTWPSNQTICVEAPDTLELTNSINGADKKTTNIVFDGIEQAGSNTEAVAVTKPISVDGIENALFGTWSGSFTYTLTVKEYDLANTTWALSDTISGYETAFQEFDYVNQTGWKEFPAGTMMKVTYTDQAGGEYEGEILGFSNYTITDGFVTFGTVFNADAGAQYIPENNGLGFPAGWYIGDSREYLEGTVTDLNELFNLYRPCTAPVITFTDGDSEVLNDTAVIDWLYANATKQANP